MNTADIELRGVTKRFGKVEAVKDLSLSIEKGELICLLGPSGCGKTTTLRMVAGFETPTQGRIIIQGEDVTDVPANKRGTGMVFQSYALFPHMTVFKNLAYGLTNRKMNKEKIKERVKEALELIGMSGMEDRYPRQLSGGQQQRVAVARALVIQPKILLFDEPLSNLDAKLRLQMRLEIMNLQKEVGITAIFVTHDQEEALSIADRVVVMRRGCVEQVGSPSEIYDAPSTRFMADFIGVCNIFKGKLEQEGQGPTWILRTSSGLRISLGETGQTFTEEMVEVVVRPESMMLSSEHPEEEDEGRYNIFPGIVESSVRLGPITQYTVCLEGGDRAIIHSQHQIDRPALAPGEQAWVRWSAQACRCLKD